MHLAKTLFTGVSRLLPRDSIAFSSAQQTVYLTHVKWITGKQQVEKYFSRFGKVENVRMFFDAETGLHRGFASVKFAKPEGAAAAIQSRPHIIDGDVVGIEFFMPMSSKKKFLTM